MAEPKGKNRRHARSRASTPAWVFNRLNGVPAKVNLSGTACRLVYWGLNPDHCNDAKAHAHSFYEVCYAFRGKGSVRVGSRTHGVSKGQLFVTRPDQVHRISSSTDKPMGIYFWAFSLESEPGMLNDDPGISALLQGFIKSHKTVAMPGPGRLEPVLELLSTEAEARGPGFAFGVTSLTRKLILETLRAFAGHQTPEGKVDTDKEQSAAPVARARLFLHDNFMRAITVGQVAQHVHLSERQLARLFLKDQKTSVAKYLANLRIEAAGRMLLAGGRSIKEVAGRTGYGDVAYFTAAFKKTTGITPGEYRKMRGKVYPLRAKGK
jgi:AraC-like DNA-binding protein/quercetin dioxygenase-like cupin family protein